MSAAESLVSFKSLEKLGSYRNVLHSSVGGSPLESIRMIFAASQSKGLISPHHCALFLSCANGATKMILFVVITYLICYNMSSVGSITSEWVCDSERVYIGLISIVLKCGRSYTLRQ